MGHIKTYRSMVAASRLAAPNLRTATLTLYTGNKDKGNEVARCVLPAVLRGALHVHPPPVVGMC